MSAQQAIWLAGILPSILIFAYAIAKTCRSISDEFGAALCAVLLGVLWPISLPFGAAMGMSVLVFKRV